MLFVALLAAWPALGVAQGAPTKPYGLEDVVALLQGHVAPDRILDMVTKPCLAFSITKDAQRRLDQAGAGAVLIAALRSVCVKPASTPDKAKDAPTDREGKQRLAAAREQSAHEQAARAEAARAEAARLEDSLHAPGSEPAASDAPWADSALAAVHLDVTEWRWVPRGTFDMGSTSGLDGERPAHRVVLTRGRWVQRTEVTQAQWQAVMGDNPSYFGTCGGDCPVEQVSWDDAQLFIQKLNSRVQGGGFRLLTEAEWEYAARAGEKPEEKDAQAWHGGNSAERTHKACTKQPTAWGLCDLLGNVLEWVEDWYGPYPAEEVTDPTGSRYGDHRVMRGGSWFGLPTGARPASRYGNAPSVRMTQYGFRLARTTP